MKRLVVVAVILVAALIAGAGWVYRQFNQDTIQLGHTEGELVFMSDRDGDWDLYLLDQQGDLHNLTAGSEAHDYYPGFSFNGNRIGFFSAAPDGVNPALVNADGTDFKTLNIIQAVVYLLIEGNLDWSPVWTPGGDRMAWNKVLAGLPPKVDLLVADTDGANPVQITDSTASEGMQAWSPDGTRLVYTADTNNHRYNTYVIDMTTQETTRLTEYDVSDYKPVWSLAGDHILVVTAPEEAMIAGEVPLYVMNPDGSGRRPLGENEVFKGNLTYSPYGGQVVYMSNETGYWHLYVMDADGSHVQPLTSGASNNLYPAWRPVPAGVGD
ncbi:MAG: PD40 domain-containing protein [Anaerolineae bacterium]|nr:PD40 domain-containing protein [Anaerolineae bacterium]